MIRVWNKGLYLTLVDTQTLVDSWGKFEIFFFCDGKNWKARLNTEKDDFDQQMVSKTPVHWSKYTTDIPYFTLDASFLTRKQNLICTSKKLAIVSKPK